MEEVANNQPSLESEERKYQIRINLGEEAYRGLMTLQNKIAAESKTALIKDALGVLMWAADEIHEGNRILVQKKDGEVKEINFRFIPRPSV